VAFKLGAAYRNRTDDLRITRGTRCGCARASCTDSTGDRTDGTRGAGIIRRPGPRTGPRPRPCVPGILLLCVNAADDMVPRPRADRAPGPTVDLHAATHTVRLADVRICRRQGLTGLPWCAGVPVRRACRTGTVPLAVELIEGHGAGGEREPGRDARMPPGSRTGLRDGRAAGRVPAVPGRSGAGRRTPARNHRAGRGSGRRPDARERRGGAGRCGPGSPGYRRVRLPGASRPIVPSR
jgi:hypothetical protein